MTTEMRLNSTADGMAEICLILPASEAVKAAEAIGSLLRFAGHDVHRIDAEGERLYTVEEVFPDASPAKILRGLRGKEDLTQAEFAERLGVAQHHVSEMENGKRGITLDMAKRIGETFNVPYKIFL